MATSPINETGGNLILPMFVKIIIEYRLNMKIMLEIFLTVSETIVDMCCLEP